MAKYDNRGSKVAEAPPATSFTNWDIKPAFVEATIDPLYGLVHSGRETFSVRIACRHWARGEQIKEGTCRHGC